MPCLTIRLKHSPCRKPAQRKILYLDLDGVLVDFASGVARLPEEERARHAENIEEAPGVFALMDPMPGAIAAFHRLAEKFEVYILSTAPWKNSTAWTDKFLWVQKHLGESAHKRLILSHRKDLNIGDFLVDDRVKNGAGEFAGELILFGSPQFPNWDAVLNYLGDGTQ